MGQDDLVHMSGSYPKLWSGAFSSKWSFQQDISDFYMAAGFQEGKCYVENYLDAMAAFHGTTRLVVPKATEQIGI